MVDQQAPIATDARSPIRGRGWTHILLRVYHGISNDRLMLIAAGVTYYAILALFPAIGVIVSIYGLFADPSRIAGHLDALSGFAPGGAVNILRQELTRLAHQGKAALGLGFVVSLAIALWSANSGVSAIFDALNAVHEEKEQRGFVKYYTTTLAFTAGAVILVLLSIAVLVALPLALDYLPKPGATAMLTKIVRWPALLVVVALALALVYRYGPCRARPQWRWITWGSAFAAVAWLGISALFSWYVASFGSYNKTYGSLGAIIGFMTWMWVSILVVLIGAKLDAELELRTAPDREADPSGEPRAKVADAAGPTQP